MLRNIAAAQSEAIFDALGNPVRRQLLRQLGAGPANVSALAESFAISRPAISRHLAQLEAAGLISHSEAGTQNIYALNAAGFSVGAEWIAAFWDEAESRLQLVARNLAEAGNE